MSKYRELYEEFYNSMSQERERQDMLHGVKNEEKQPMSPKFFQVLMEECGEVANASDKIEHTYVDDIPINVLKQTYLSECVEVATVAMYMWLRVKNKIEQYESQGQTTIPRTELF